MLLYNVNDDLRFSNSLFNDNNSKMVEMLNGNNIWINLNLTIIDGGSHTADAGVVDANISASNGAIHVIDAVMAPRMPQVLFLGVSNG